MADMEGFGLTLDRERNAARSDEARIISASEGRVAVAVVPTDEELEIAQQTFALVTSGSRTGNP